MEGGGVVRFSESLPDSNAAPILSLDNIPATGVARENISFSVTATDVDNDELHFAWDFGEQIEIVDGMSLSRRFPFGGSYSGTLYVTDQSGGLTTHSFTLTLSDPAREFTARTSGVTGALLALATDGATAVALGNKGTILTSFDGTTWSPQAIAGFTGNLSFKDVIWTGSEFLAVCHDYKSSVSGWVGNIYRSPDGADWTRVYEGTTADSRLNGIASSSGIHLAVGQAGILLRSTDGTTWSSVGSPTLGTTELRGIAWGDGTFVIFGDDGERRVFTSPDGLTWTDQTSGTSLASWQGLTDVEYLNDRFVGSGWYSKLRVSTNQGASFLTPRSASERMLAKTHGGGIYFTSGINQSDSNAQIDLLSLDGEEWYRFPSFTTRARRDAAFFKNTFLTVGDGGEIWQSGLIETLSGFALWQSDGLADGQLEVEITNDPDEDGLVNLVEYAFGFAAFDASEYTAPATVTGETFTASGHHGIVLDMPENPAEDVTYRILGQAGLTGPWVPVAEKTGTSTWTWLATGANRLSEGAASNGRIPTTVGIPSGNDSEDHYYFRIAVELN